MAQCWRVQAMVSWSVPMVCRTSWWGLQEALCQTDEAREHEIRASVPLKVHSPNSNKAFHEAAPLKGSNMP